MESLTSEQRHVFNTVQSGKNIFLTGRGGVGKSYIIGVLYDEMPKRRTNTIGLGVKVAVTALTGCAAILLGPFAKTIHSWAGIGLGKESVDELIGRIRRNARAKKNWASTDILIIDEISMMTPELLEKLDDIGRIIRKNRTKPFGGIQVILSGDFLQLPPVQKGEDIKFAFESSRWSQIVAESIELTQVLRQKDDVFRKVLAEARMGALSADSVRILEGRMNLDWQKLRIRPTLLFPRRAEVDMINEANLAALKGARHTYKASIVCDEKAAGFNTKSEEFKRMLTYADKEASYMTELVLAEGAQVMLTSNLDIEKGLVNGSRGVVTGFLDNPDHTPVVDFLCGIKHMPMSQEKWEIEGYKGVFRAQIPLRLAYALTTHRSQGATLDCALIDIGANIFEFGQAYVALSRVRSLDCLYIHDFDETAFCAHGRVIRFYESLTRVTAELINAELINTELIEDPVVIKN